MSEGLLQNAVLTREMVEAAAVELAALPLEPSFVNETVHFTNAGGKPLGTKRLVARALMLARQEFYTHDADQMLVALGYVIYVATIDKTIGCKHPESEIKYDGDTGGPWCQSCGRQWGQVT